MAKGKEKTKTTRGKGRPEPPAFVEGIVAGGQVTYIPLVEIDLADETFMFRAHMRNVDLRRSIEDEGQQLPIIVRRKAPGGYQVISGFRRVHAIRAIGDQGHRLGQGRRDRPD